jgi:hypothetical protein
MAVDIMERRGRRTGEDAITHLILIRGYADTEIPRWPTKGRKVKLLCAMCSGNRTVKVREGEGESDENGRTAPHEEWMHGCIEERSEREEIAGNGGRISDGTTRRELQ